MMHTNSAKLTNTAENATSHMSTDATPVESSIPVRLVAASADLHYSNCRCPHPAPCGSQPLDALTATASTATAKRIDSR